LLPKKIWGYTRVSSKPQLVNNSLKSKNEIVQFANARYVLKERYLVELMSASRLLLERNLLNYWMRVRKAKTEAFWDSNKVY
jgi:hypothetical protein